MKLDKKIIKNNFDDLKLFLKLNGFKKNGNKFMIDYGEVVHTVDFQKSMYGPEYYVNTGIFLKPDRVDSKPLLETYDFGSRFIKQIDGKKSGTFLLNQEKDVAEVKKLIESNLKIIKNIKTITDVREILGPEGYRNIITLKAKKILGLIK